ncbi:hypothetical protein R7070_16590 [Vibrio sp. 1557]|uniref:hypothetical protein n=1 Tax=Vibrio sp. 1557 TaxID=3074561 RepID=UPI0029649130|nr:hypothetical protein [Vibrio sp. 1557]MDW2264384.1 hypothetical protein [Vibrio sp. 1557]
MQKQTTDAKVTVKQELNKRAISRECVGFSLSKDMTDNEIESVMLAKLYAVRKELGLT